MNIGNMLFKDISKPARYVGGEVNQVVKKKKDIKCNVVLCYPNIYEKAMSNNIVNMLYININNINEIYCTRCFSPDTDFEKLLREKRCNLYSLENFESIKYSDILLFVITDELEFTNFLCMLELAGINKNDNVSNTPKIIAVSNSKVNIELLNKYINVVFAENDDIENVKKVVKYLENYVNLNTEKEYMSVKLKGIADGIIPSIKIENSSIIVDLSSIDNVDTLINEVKESIKKRGINQVSFVNYDKITEIEFCEIIYRLKMNVDGIRICAPNIDFNSFSPKMLNVILPCIEKSNLMFNVISCSTKIISKLNIGTDKELLFARMKDVFKNGRNSIKLVFNLGIPTETFEDIDNIFEIAEEIVNMYSEFKAKDKLSITVCINIYIPTIKEIEEYNVNNINKLDTKIRYIKKKKSDPVIKWKIENTDRYMTKLLLKNGMEDVVKIVERAYELGARFDDDIDKYNKIAWEKAILENNEITKKYVNNR